MQKVPDVIPLVPYRGGEVVWPVALDMMMFDMMVVIRVPGVSVEWIQDIRVQHVDERVREAFR